MDSRLAADPVARQILETLATLEKAAGVRAHYRILDPPPVSSTDHSTIQTLARVLGDWIGLRNAMFDVTIIEHDEPPRLFRVDPDHEEFAMELSSRSLSSPETALAAVTRQVARAYLINSNIAASSVDPTRSGGSLADITAVFLGMGKLIMNAPAAGAIALSKNYPQTPENQPLSADYLAFTHRLVCAMRGLDWAQHTSGMSADTIARLRKWDNYRDSVFSQALRNVLTASASHRPLMDAVEDNHLALARFDQLQRTFTATVLVPLQAEMEQYHRTCREGTEKLNTREQDTYDPCLLYLNQLRRRMDLQRYADRLQAQQDHIVNRLRVLTAGISDLGARNLIRPEHAADHMKFTHCPFDGTPISIENEKHDARVKCPRCGYNFFATPGVPQISALRQNTPSLSEVATNGAETEDPATNTNGAIAKSGTDKISKTGAEAAKPSRKNRSATVLTVGIILLPLSWLPVIGYVILTLIQGQESPLTPVLGHIGLVGSVIAAIVIALGLAGLIRHWIGRSRNVKADVPAEPSPAEDIRAAS